MILSLRQLVLACALGCALFADFAAAQALDPDAQPKVATARRHIFFLRDGLDALWGNYVFAVDNPGQVATRFSMPVMLPKETVDWQGLEGIESNDLTLAQSEPVLAKDFPPGVHIVGFGFRVDGRDGSATLTLRAPIAIESLTVLVPKDSTLEVNSPQLSKGEPDDSPDPSYIAYLNTTPLDAGATIRVDVVGIPRGRGMLWNIGGIFAGLLVLATGALAWRTRPRLGGEADGRDMVSV